MSAAAVHAGGGAGQCVGRLSGDGVHRSTCYRLMRRVDRWGLEALNIRERRRPRMPNEIVQHLEQRIVAFGARSSRPGTEAHRGRVGQRGVGRIRVSEHGVWRVLCQVGLKHPFKRLALVARHPDSYEQHLVAVLGDQDVVLATTSPRSCSWIRPPMPAGRAPSSIGSRPIRDSSTGSATAATKVGAAT
jgi:hypothetical protein